MSGAGAMERAGPGAAVPVSRDVVTLDPGRIIRALRRQGHIVGIAALAGAAWALLVATGTVPRYQSAIMILLDEERSELLQLVSALPSAVISDAAIQSEMEIIRSRVLALEVVDRLSLDEDPEFLSPPVDATARVEEAIKGLLRPVVDLLGPDAEVAENGSETQVDPAVAARERAASILLSQIVVERVERSFVMRVTYTGFDPEQTALIARTYGEAYTGFQLSSTTEVAENAGDWIRDRLELLEERTIAAASDVQRFRVENGLVQVRGDLLTDQQQSEMATALVTAATEAAALRAQLESFEALREGSAAEMAAVAAQLGEDDAMTPLVQLRNEYAETRRNLAAVLAQGGEEHPQAAWLQAEIDALESDIAVELEGAVAGLRTRYDIARSREAALREELAAISATQEGNAEVMGQLAQLEAIASTYAAVYGDYLLRYETTAQQQGFPVASVQIISDAEVPRDPTSPRKLRMLATGLLLGGLVGLMIAALREMRTMPLCNAGDVVDYCGLPCAGLIPNTARPGRDGLPERIAMRTAERIRQEIDRRGQENGGRIVGLAAVEAGTDMSVLTVALARTLAERSGRVMVVDAGGLRKAAERDLRQLGSVEIWTYAELRTALYSGGAEDGGLAALQNLRESWPYCLILMPPLTQSVVADQMAWMFDATVMTIPWGQVPPDLVVAALRDQQDFGATLATTVLDGADLNRARRLLDPKDYEARVLHG